MLMSQLCNAGGVCFHVIVLSRRKHHLCTGVANKILLGVWPVLLPWKDWQLRLGSRAACLASSSVVLMLQHPTDGVQKAGVEKRCMHPAVLIANHQPNQAHVYIYLAQGQARSRGNHLLSCLTSPVLFPVLLSCLLSGPTLREGLHLRLCCQRVGLGGFTQQQYAVQNPRVGQPTGCGHDFVECEYVGKCFSDRCCPADVCRRASCVVLLLSWSQFAGCCCCSGMCWISSRCCPADQVHVTHSVVTVASIF